jgi:hypothetical protein
MAIRQKLRGVVRMYIYLEGNFANLEGNFANFGRCA